MSKGLFNIKVAAYFLIGIGALLLWFVFSSTTQAASYNISPSGGEFTVGSTFEVSVLLNTEGQNINAVQTRLSFPPDKLQLVSPSTGSSIIEIYTTPPRFDNNAGVVEIIGGIPNGINVSSGLITKLTFRVRGVGQAALRFTGESQVLLNDGRGTNVLDNTFGATYNLILPPQQGPIIISDTHPDQESWYQNANVKLMWDVGFPPAESYSYTISDNPSDIPDDIPEGNQTEVSYEQVPNGINYFHIKAFREGRWGGVSRYSLRVDNQAPTDFDIEVIPGLRTRATKPVFQFFSSDSLSGLDRYELKIVPLKLEGRDNAINTEQLFVEVEPPYIVSTDLLYGSYVVIIRAYDKAGNIREKNQEFLITASAFWFLSQDGVTLPFVGLVKWWVLLPLLLIIIILLIIIAYLIRLHYKHTHKLVEERALPDTIKGQLDELQKYRDRYGKIAAVFLMAVIASYMFIVPVKAAELTPPVIDSYSSNIKDDELFYVSGRTPDPETDVVVHLQSLVDGGAFDFTTRSDRRGDWIYRHTDFLKGGQYLIWAHTRDGEQLSVPSPQVTMDVKPVAINWGNSRITYQSIYIGIIAGLIFLIILLIIYIIWHFLLVRHRRKQFAVQLRQAEDSIKRGFLALRRDIEAELELIKQAHLPEQLAGEQKVRSEQLEQDLKSIEDIVGKEIWEVESFEKLPNQN